MQFRHRLFSLGKGVIALAAGAALGFAYGGSAAYAKGGGGTATPNPTPATPQITVTAPPPPAIPLPTFTGNAARINQFDTVGFIQDLTVDGSRCPAVTDPHNFGGTVTVNGITIVVPCNSILQMPAAAFTWADFADTVTFPTPVTLNAAPPAFASVEIRVVGNLVAGEHIAGLIFISQQSLNAGQGYVTGFDYANGVMFVGDDTGVPQVRVQLNDPNGRFSVGQAAPDARFTVDDENPTIHAASGYPMCIPRTDPAAADDPLCPQRNRPLAANNCRNFAQAGVALPKGSELAPPRLGQVFCTGFVMGDPATAGPTDPISTEQVPFEVGDYVTYSGTLVHDGLGPNGSDTLAAHTIEGNIGAYTQPGTQPVYVATGEFGVGADANQAAASIAGVPQEATDRLFFIAMVTDVKSVLDIYMQDFDPTTGAESDRWITPEAMTGGINAANSPNTQPYLGGITTQFTGALPGRARVRTTPHDTPTGLIVSPTRNMLAVVRSLCTPDIINSLVSATAGALPANANGTTILDPAGVPCRQRNPAANGLFAGEFSAPTFDYIFAEALVPGDLIVPNNFWDLGFLVNGEGPGTGPLIPQPW